MMTHPLLYLIVCAIDGSNSTNVTVDGIRVIGSLLASIFCVSKEINFNAPLANPTTVVILSMIKFCFVLFKNIQLYFYNISIEQLDNKRIIKNKVGLENSNNFNENKEV